MASTYPPNYNYNDDDSFLQDDGDEISYSYVEGEEGPYSAPLPNRPPPPAQIGGGRGPLPPPPGPPQGYGGPPQRGGPAGPIPGRGPRVAPPGGPAPAPYRYQPEEYAGGPPRMRGAPPPAGPMPRVGSMQPYAANNSSFPPGHGGGYSRSFNSRYASAYEPDFPVPPDMLIDHPTSMYSSQPMSRQSLYMAQQQELERCQRVRGAMPRRTEEEDALYVAMLCSEQEALYGTNMLEDITPEDRIFIDSLIARGVPENEALRVSFERKPHPYRTKPKAVDTDADKNSLEEAIMLSLSESSARASRPDPPSYSAYRGAAPHATSVSRSRSHEDAELSEALRISERVSHPPAPLFPEPVIDYTKLEDVPKPSAQADEDALQAAIRLSMAEGGAPVQYGLEDSYEYGGRAHSYAEGDKAQDHYRMRNKPPPQSIERRHRDDDSYGERQEEKSFIQREIEQRKAMFRQQQLQQQQQQQHQQLHHHQPHYPVNGDIRRAIDAEADVRHRPEQQRGNMRRDSSMSSVGSDITGEDEMVGEPTPQKHADRESPRYGERAGVAADNVNPLAHRGDHAALIMQAAHRNEHPHGNVLAQHHGSSFHHDGNGMVRRPSLVEMRKETYMLQRENSGISDLGMGSASRHDSADVDGGTFSKSQSQEFDKNRSPEQPHHAKYRVRGSMHSTDHLDTEQLPHHNSSANLRRLISKITMDVDDDDDDDVVPSPMPVRAAPKGRPRAFDDLDEKAR